MKLIGFARLGKTAELRYLQSGKAVANLALAVNWGRRDESGNQPTQWIEAVMWEKQAESLAQFMVKGSAHCFTLSDIHIETYQKADGSEGTKLVARVDGVDLGPRTDSAPAQHPARQAPAARPAQPLRQAPARQPAQTSATGIQRQPAPPASSGFDDMDSDIPFISCDWALEIDTSKSKRMRGYDF